MTPQRHITPGNGLATPQAGARGSVDAAGSVAVEVLLRDVATGNHAAFSGLLDHVDGYVYGLACQMAEDRSGAEDAATNALVAIWREAPRFDPATDRALSWMLTIARAQLRHDVGPRRTHIKRAVALASVWPWDRR